MKRFWTILSLALAVLLFAAQPGLAYAGGASALAASACKGSHSVIADSYTLAAGQQLDTNLVVIGSTATIAPGAIVNCQVVVMGGSLDVAGKVLGNVVVMGGDVRLRSTAEIDGQVQTLGGNLTQDDGAQVKGGVGQGFSIGNSGPSRPVVNGFLSPISALVAFYRTVARTFLGSLGLGLLALLVVLFWPAQTARVRAAVSNAPGQSGALGLLTVVAVPVLMLVATITVCLIPVAFIAGLVLTGALVFGWIALGDLVGQRLAGTLKLVNLSPAVAAGLGTALLSLVVAVISWVPCIGWLAPVLLAAIGLGAVTLTRFGTQPYFPTAPAAPIQPALNA
jgi:hypothetical protein